MCKAAPFADLTRDDFDRIVELVSDGIPTGRGRVAAYLHRDQINGEVRARRGARLAALTSGGAIPETGDYRVLAEPDDTFIGTVNEDWAIESSAGDIFLLGSTSWKIRRVVAGTVRVVDAHGAPPSVPFWNGEAPGRTLELSEAVAGVREAIASNPDQSHPEHALQFLIEKCGLDAKGLAASILARFGSRRSDAGSGGHSGASRHTTSAPARTRSRAAVSPASPSTSAARISPKRHLPWPAGPPVAAGGTPVAAGGTAAPVGRSAPPGSAGSPRDAPGSSCTGLPP